MKLIILIVASLTFLSCASQKNVKLYAYSQAVIPGGSPRGAVDERTGTEIKQEYNGRLNYFIFIEMPAGKLEVKELWIKQQPFKANLQSVQPPFIIKSDVNMETHVLVPKTSNKVWRVAQGAQFDIGVSDSIEKKLMGKEVLVRCLVNGKERFYSVSTIKKLPPAALQ